MLRVDGNIFESRKKNLRIHSGVPSMGPRVPFAPALLGLRIIVLSTTIVCFPFFFFLEVKPNKADIKKIYISGYMWTNVSPDIFESATFSFRIPLPFTRIRRIRWRIRNFFNTLSRVDTFLIHYESGTLWTLNPQFFFKIRLT